MPRLGIVLAAGRSERLKPVTGGGSKALLRLGGLTLIERAVRGLLHAGVEQVVVVVGYQAGPVAAVVKRISPGRARTVLARDWEHGNGASLAAAERMLGPSDDIFALVTMDHLFDEAALAGLVRTGRPAVLVDPSPASDVWAEGTRVRIRRGAAVAFSKQLRTSGVDCGAFLLPRSVFDALREARADGDHSLAGALTRLAESKPLHAVHVPTGSWWMDIDTPEDLRAAKRRLRTALVKTADGPVARYLNRPLSTRVSMAIAPLGISPDVLSIVSAAVGFVGAWLLASGYGLGGALLVHLCSVLDGVDGEVARLRLRAGPRGALLDGILDRVVDTTIAVGLGFWALRTGGDPNVVVALVGAVTATAMLSMASKDRIAALGLLPAPERLLGWLLGGRDGRLLLMSIFAVAGRPMWALAAASAAAGLSLLLRVGGVLRRPVT